MNVYAVQVMGWIAIIEAETKREALRQARSLAPSASLLPSDVQESCIRPATPEDVAWWKAMA